MPIENRVSEEISRHEDYSDRGILYACAADGSIIWELDALKDGELQYVRFDAKAATSVLIRSFILRDNDLVGGLYDTWMEERPTSLEEMAQFSLRAKRDLGEEKASRLLGHVEQRIRHAARQIGMTSLEE